jgi:succinoglycan biosynthesis protein ExoO
MIERPIVSVVTANFNGARFLASATRSVLSHRLVDLEWIVADDASSDGSAEAIAELAKTDGRVVFLPADTNGGPACARNRALDVARGQWIAVFDIDDEMAPNRLGRLIAQAVAEQADIIVDNLTLFGAQDGAPDRPFLVGEAWGRPRWISLADYIESARMYARGPGLGYLKPIFRAETLGDMRYREDLRIGEDYDFVVRLLARGAKLRLDPSSHYRYRRHGASISAVLKPFHIEQMLAADADIGLETSRGDCEPGARRAQARRRRSLEAALVYDRVIEALKRRRPAAALAYILGRPDVWPLLTMPLKARAKRMAARVRRPRSLSAGEGRVVG